MWLRPWTASSLSTSCWRPPQRPPPRSTSTPCLASATSGRCSLLPYLSVRLGSLPLLIPFLARQCLGPRPLVLAAPPVAASLPRRSVGRSGQASLGARPSGLAALPQSRGRAVAAVASSRCRRAVVVAWVRLRLSDDGSTAVLGPPRLLHADRLSKKRALQITSARGRGGGGVDRERRRGYGGRVKFVSVTNNRRGKRT